MRTLFPLLTALLIGGACHKPSSIQTDRLSPSQTSPLADSPSEIDASKLLTSEEIRSVLGEPLKAAIPNTRIEAGFAISQCYFSLPTDSHSAVLTVTSRGQGADAREPRNFWMGKFHPDREAEEGEREEEGRKPAPPEKVDGAGDEAFWVESGSTGALYILQGNSFMRVALGGTDEKAARISKAKKLAEFALRRINKGGKSQ